MDAILDILELSGELNVPDAPLPFRSNKNAAAMEGLADFEPKDDLEEMLANPTPLPKIEHHTDPQDIIVMNDPTFTPNQWPPRLVVDLALGMDDLETILTRYELPIHQYNAIAANPVFRRQLVETTKELQESGVTFKRKAALQAELYLEDMDALMRDAITPPSVKTDIFKTMAKLGELEPAKNVDDRAGAATFNLQINLQPI